MLVNKYLPYEDNVFVSRNYQSDICPRSFTSWANICCDRENFKFCGATISP